MKSIYIPTDEELAKLQEHGVNIYNYMLAKLIEAIIMDTVANQNCAPFDVAYEEYPEFKEIKYAIAKIFPRELNDSEYVRDDVELSRELSRIMVRKKTEDNTYKMAYLNNLPVFNQSDSIVNDKETNENIIIILSSILNSNPEYRFTYVESMAEDGNVIKENSFLKNIFLCSIKNISEYGDSLVFSELLVLDPIYAIKYEMATGIKLDDDMLTRAMFRYESRYGIANDLIRQFDKDEYRKRINKMLNGLHGYREIYQQMCEKDTMTRK